MKKFTEIITTSERFIEIYLPVNGVYYLYLIDLSKITAITAPLVNKEEIFSNMIIDGLNLHLSISLTDLGEEDYKRGEKFTNTIWELSEKWVSYIKRENS